MKKLFYFFLILSFDIFQCEVSLPLEKFLAVAEMANGVGTVIQSARSYHHSRNPVAYMPYEMKPQSKCFGYSTRNEMTIFICTQHPIIMSLRPIHYTMS
jgi:hypothetical protein